MPTQSAMYMSLCPSSDGQTGDTNTEPILGCWRCSDTPQQPDDENQTQTIFINKGSSHFADNLQYLVI